MINTKVTEIINNENTILKRHEVDNSRITWSIQGAFTDALIPLLKGEGTFGFSILHGENWDLSFLRECGNNIKVLCLPDQWSRYKLDGIESLVNLEELILDAQSSSRVSFANLKRLKSVSIQWQKNYSDDLFECPLLEKLYLTSYKGKTIEPLTRAKVLTKVDIYSCSFESLQGIGDMSCLKELSLHNFRKLTSLVGIDACETLEKLRVTASNKITDFSALAKTPNLKRLDIELKQIDSVNFLENHPALEEVYLYETKVLDGDVSVFKTLPNLKYIHFANKCIFSCIAIT